jgi:pimeloyl-ACP methyl ester carboxylesterase
VLLAESFSGPVGVAIAASAASNLKGLILCCSFASNPLPVFGSLSRLIGLSPAVKVPNAWAAPWLYAGHATPQLRKLHAQAMDKVSAATLRARVAAILAVDYSAKVRDVNVPMLYLLATADRLVPRSAFEKIRRLRPGIEVREFDAPHFLLQTVPWSASERVKVFLDR